MAETQKKVAFRNISGRFYFFPELGENLPDGKGKKGKRVMPNDKAKYFFTEEEATSCKHLKDLILGGQIVPWDSFPPAPSDERQASAQNQDRTPTSPQSQFQFQTAGRQDRTGPYAIEPEQGKRLPPTRQPEPQMELPQRTFSTFTTPPPKGSVVLQNISGRNFFINDLGDPIKNRDGKIIGKKGKKIPSDPNVLHYFTDKDIEDSTFLKNLMDGGFLVSPNFEDQGIEAAEEPSQTVAPFGNGFDNNVNEEKSSVFGQMASNFSKTSIKSPNNEVFEKPTYEDPEPVVASFGNLHKTAEQIEESSVEVSESETIDSPPEEHIDQTEVWWTGPAADAGGYGKMNREILHGLYLRKDLKIHHEPFNVPDQRAKLKASESLANMMETEVADDAHSVYAIMPPKFFNRRGKKILYTMMECNEVPPSFLERCERADELWLPSKHNMGIFEEANISIPTYHIPLGVDIERYKPIEIENKNENKFNLQLNSFVFVSVFGWSHRKGKDALFKAFLEEFTGDDDVSLLLVSREWGSAKNAESIQNEIREYIKAYCKNTENIPHIAHVPQAVPEEDMPLLYNLGDAFVLPTRGEGFGLPGLEAGACGLPVIMTRCGGQLDYLDNDNSYLLDIEGYVNNTPEIKDIQKISSYYEDMPFAKVGDKTVSELKEAMRDVINNNSKAKEKADLLRKNIEENFTWDQAVEKCYERLKA